MTFAFEQSNQVNVGTAQLVDLAGNPLSSIVGVSNGVVTVSFTNPLQVGPTDMREVELRLGGISGVVNGGRIAIRCVSVLENEIGFTAPPLLFPTMTNGFVPVDEAVDFIFALGIID